MVSKIAPIIALVFAITFAAPLVILLVTATTPAQIIQVLGQPRLPGIIWTTFYPAALGGGLSLTFATIYAWLVYRTDVPGKKILSLLPLLGLTMPSVVRGISLVFLFAPKIGIFNIWFDYIFKVNFPLFNIYSNNGLALAHVAGAFPFCYLLMSVAVRGMDSSLEESSRLAGSSVISTFRKISLPLLRPAIITTFFVTLAVAAANFDYPYIFGQSASSGVNTLATAIDSAINDELPPQYGVAASYSLIYLAFTFIIVTLYIISIKRGYKYMTVSGNPPPQTIYSLQKWKYLALVLCLGIIGIAWFVEAFIVAFVSFLPFYSFGIKALTHLTFNNYWQLFFSKSYPLFWTAFRNSIEIAILVGITTAIIGTFIAYVVVKSKFTGAKVFEYFNTIPFAIPGIVYGLAMLWTFTTLPYIAKYVYGTVWLLIIALVVTWMPYSIRLTAASLLQIPDSMEEAAITMGARWVRMFRTILLPLLRIAVLTAFTYIFLDTFRELGLVILLTTPNSYVLTTFIADLYTSSGASFDIIAATATIMMITAAAFIVFASEVLGVNFLASSVKKRSLLERLLHKRREPEEKEDRPVESLAIVGAATGA